MAEVEKDGVALETVQKDLRLEYDVQDDPTEFWQSQPGVLEDVQAGRAAARQDLHDEAEVRSRYEVTGAPMADLMALVVARRDGKTADDLQSILNQMTLGWVDINSRAEAHRKLDEILNQFAKTFGDDQEPSLRPDAPYMGGG